LIITVIFLFCDQINPVYVGKKKKKKKKKDDEIEENFYDIVDMDEGHAREFITDKFIPRFLQSPGYRTFMMAVIFLNAVELALRTNDELVRLSVKLPITIASTAFLTVLIDTRLSKKHLPNVHVIALCVYNIVPSVYII